VVAGKSDVLELSCWEIDNECHPVFLPFFLYPVVFRLVIYNPLGFLVCLHTWLLSFI
jgi:hypothetical protein